MASLLTGTTIAANIALHAGNYNSYALPLTGGAITGNSTFSADNYLTFGPNSSWSRYLRIGGNGYTAPVTTTASVVTTNGNLHLDAAKAAGMAIYLNWYGGAGGTIFGNGSGTQVGAVDGSGNASFIGTMAITGAITQNGNQVLHAGNYTSYPDATKLPLTGGTLTGQLNINHSTPTSVLRLYSGGSTIWSLGVGDASGSYFNITADFGSFTINKTNGYVGIGTTSQVARIQLGSGTPTSATDGIQFGGDTSARLYRTAAGVITCPGTIAATFSGSGASLTSLTAGNLSGTIPSAVLGNSALFIGTTSIALNRASATQLLAGVNIDGYANYISAQTNPIGAFNVGLTRPKGASYTTTASTVTGAIKIKMPPGTPVHGMWKMTIKIYEYGSRGNGYTIECGCHLYPSTAHNRYQYAIGVNSNIALTIRYGTDGTSGCIWIGENATTWSYPQIHVTEFSNGFNNPGSVDWSAGTWGVTIGNIDNSVAVDGPYTIGLPLASTAGSCTGNAATVTNGVYTNTNNTLTAITTIYNTSNTLINNLSGNLGLTMYQATAGTDAYMTFHIGSDYAAYFGLGGAENDLVYGGWSVGNVRRRILHSGNAAYAWNMNQYVRTTDSPTFAAVSATTFTGALSGNATTATNGFTSKPGWAGNTNLIQSLPNFNNSVPSGFYEYNSATNSPSATWYNLINVRHSNTGNDHGFQLAMSYYDNNLWFRSYQGGTGANNGTFQSWAKTLSDQNYTDYTVTKTGTGASGTWAINITGNAVTATTATNVTIANGSVTLAKIENIAAYTILGNSNVSAAATPAALSVATVASMLSGQTMNINGSAATANALNTGNTYTIAGLTSNGTINIFPPYSGGYSYFLRMGYDNSGNYDYTVKRNGTTGFLEFNGTQTGFIGYVFSSGNLGVGTSPSSYKLDVNGPCHATSFPTSSDARFKKNVKPLENCVDKVKKMQGVSYEWNEFVNHRRDGYSLNTAVLGVIAQDLEKILPEVVSKWHLSDDCKDARAVDYIRIIPVLIEAIKEQQIELDDLKNRLIRLENK